MTTADPFLPEQGDPDTSADLDDDLYDDDDDDDDWDADEARGEHPDPEGDGVDDEGLPPMTPSVFRAPAGEAVDPADD